MTDQTRPPLRIEIAIPERLESLLYTFFDRGIPALVRIADALERLQGAPVVRGPHNDIEIVRQAAQAPEFVELKVNAAPTPPAQPSARVGTTANVWSEARLKFLDQKFQLGADHTALLYSINILPGRAISTVEAMLIKAKNLGLGDDLEGWAARNRPAVKPALAEKQPSQWVTKFTPERAAHLKANWRAADTKVKKEALLAEINAMPGPSIANADAMMAKVYTERWHKEAAPAVQASIAPQAPVYASVPRPAPAEARKPSMSPEELARIKVRKAKLKEMFERGEDAKQIMIALNRMPGPILTERDVVTRAAAFGFKRPPPLPPEAFAKGGSVTIDEIKKWFTEAGGNPTVIPTEERLLNAANALRTAMKLPPFEVIA